MGSTHFGVVVLPCFFLFKFNAVGVISEPAMSSRQLAFLNSIASVLALDSWLLVLWFLALIP